MGDTLIYIGITASRVLYLLSFQVSGALRMSVKMFLMWNSKMIIDGGGDANVATSLLEASNLVVLKVYYSSSPCLNFISIFIIYRDRPSHIVHCYFRKESAHEDDDESQVLTCLAFSHFSLVRDHLLYIPMRIWGFTDRVC